MKVVIESVGEGMFCFRLLDSDGQALATGRSCRDKGMVLVDIAAVMHQIGAADVEDRTCWPAAADGHRLDRAIIGRAGSPPPI
jgi:hypothetical protein